MLIPAGKRFWHRPHLVTGGGLLNHRHHLWNCCGRHDCVDLYMTCRVKILVCKESFSAMANGRRSRHSRVHAITYMRNDGPDLLVLCRSAATLIALSRQCGPAFVHLHERCHKCALVLLNTLPLDRATTSMPSGRILTMFSLIA